MHIKDVARRTGLTPKAIRYYQRVGVVPPPARNDAGYRCYEEADAQRLEFIAIAKGAGLGLEEIAEVLEASTGNHINCNQVVSVLEDKVGELRERLADLQALHDAVEHTLAAARRHEFPVPARPFECPLIERTVEERRALARSGHGEAALVGAGSG